MAKCLISFGANIGDAWSTIQSAAARLQALLCQSSRVVTNDSVSSTFQLSRCFRTPPVGGPAGQPPFINAVAAVSTEATIWDVWHSIRAVEKEFGRERNLRWEARRIDLDILLYGNARIWTPHLKVPHPRMCMRRFILLPAVDVAGDWLDPVSGWTIGQLADNLRTGGGNFVLVSDAASKPESLLAEVARRTGAEWRDPNATVANTAGVSGSHSSAGRGRWVAAIVKPTRHAIAVRGEATMVSNALPDTKTIGGQPILEQPVLEKSGTKLVIALAPKVQAADVAWEDYHQPLAVELGMQANAGVIAEQEVCASAQATAWRGPRYLLASDDPDWAVQELVAALEAMDCPIEVV